MDPIRPRSLRAQARVPPDRAVAAEWGPIAERLRHAVRGAAPPDHLVEAIRSRIRETEKAPS
jgi:hypothetical protein